MDAKKTPSVWKAKFNTVTDYWKSFDAKYYEFDKYETEVNPDEDVDDFNNYDATKQRLEYTKCALSFAYFANKYVRIRHPKRGLIPFVLFKYQRRVVQEFDEYRFNIISKFRQGGLTTVAEIWGMWRCMFRLDQQIMLLSKTDVEAIAAGEIINIAIQNLPTWMKPSEEGKWNDHHKQFYETGGNMHFGTPERARGRAITYLIVDEAAFIPDMEKHWRAMYPTLSTGGSCIVISTVNGLGNWYEETYHGAREKKNKFHVIDLDYWEHPEYDNPEWVKDQKAQLREKGWLQEVMRSFLGSGETYIPAHIIGELQVATRNNDPKRKLFKKWANAGDINESGEDSWESDGAMWVWKEPQEGHDYIMGADCAEGVGDDGDNSCFQIFDSSNLEQVAEFYSNMVPPHIFAQIISEVGIYYNHALVIVENMGAGLSVLSHLQNELYYDNLFYEPPTGKSSKTIKPGIKTSLSNKPVFLESLQYRLMNGTIRINSRRFVKELNTFIYNAQTRKAQPQKGKHDDAIMAICFALYVRDSVLRDVPMGGEIPKDLESAIKTSVYEEIKREIMEGAPEDLFIMSKDKVVLPDEDDALAGVVYSFRRKNSRLLESFFW